MTFVSSSGYVNSPQLITIFYNIATQELEGIMRVEAGKLKKELYFKNGLLVGGRSNIIKETFGRQLFENGLLSQSDYKDSLNEVLNKKRKHGVVLQERGLLPININDALKLQLRMRFIYTFIMTDGSFHFHKTGVPDSVVLQLSLPILNLVKEGVKLHLSKDVISEFINKNINRICVRGDAHYDPLMLNLTQKELNLLSTLESNKTLKELLQKTSMNADESMSLVYLFIGLGFVRLVEQQKKKPEAIRKELTEEHKKLLEELKDKRDELKNNNCYECLNVNKKASGAVIKKAYFIQVKQYHPDHFFNYPAEIKEVVSEIFALISAAHETLSNDNEREKYDEYLKTGKQRIENDEANRIVKAELQFQKGNILLKSNNLKEAYENFKWAVELNPTEGEYLSYLGWIIFKCEPDSDEARRKALEYIERGLQLNKEQDTGYYFLGRILKVKGDAQRAMEAFRTSYAKNQHNVDALREIRTYELAQKSRKGMFRKLFK